MALPRVMLADDHTILVEAFRKLLEPHCEIVAAVADGRALLETATELKPDVIVADISMPLMNGLEAGLRLKELLPAMKLIFLTMNEDHDLAVEALRCGASGYLLKTSAASELIRAIQLALKGKSYVTPQIAKGMQKASIHNPNPGSKARAKTLTARQREVAAALVWPKTAGCTPPPPGSSTRRHEAKVLSSLDLLQLKSNADLVQYAIRRRIISL